MKTTVLVLTVGLLVVEATVSLHDALATQWWLCPNEPRCSHGAILHDVDDYDDPTPRCCVDGCACGAAA